MKFLSNQRGFAVVEVVLAVLLVAALGAAGYFAYQAHHSNTTKTVLQKSSTTSPSVSVKPGERFNVKELGVYLTLPSGLSASDLIYQADTASHSISDANGKNMTIIASADFSTNSLIAAGGNGDDGTPACGAAAMPFGEVDLLDSNPTDFEFASGPELIKQIGKDYLAVERPQSSCSQDQKAQDLAASQTKLLDKALQTAQPLQ